MKGGKNALAWDKCNGKEEGRKYNTFVVHRGIPYNWKYWPSLRFGPKPTIKIWQWRLSLHSTRIKLAAC